ncbi:HEAT repeat domain-containing protein [Pendulispora brunnea]|uniref:HEAT repeat domain-containing protein n=1 Tax=Pendulispora brunnea TaxID=2905690 RepID=A0ABZ2K3N2_9BACT
MLSTLMNGKRGLALAWMMGLSVLLLVAAPSRVHAEDRTQFLITRLQYPPAAGVADDFRIRTSAALGLGSLADVAERDKAITPLCQSLSSDPSDIVRQSVAAALKRLNRPSAASCVRNRLANEGNAQVKMQLQRTLDALEGSSGSGGGGGGSPASSSGPWTPKFVQNARYYVAISAITNNTGRPIEEVERAILPALRGKIESLGGYQLAPAKEGMDAARATISKRKLKGYYLAISVEKFDYAGGNLRVRVKCAVFDYPGKNLRGEVPAGLTQAGVRPGDHSAEQNLMGMAAERAAELFAQNFQ